MEELYASYTMLQTAHITQVYSSIIHDALLKQNNTGLSYLHFADLSLISFSISIISLLFFFFFLSHVSSFHPCMSTLGMNHAEALRQMLLIFRLN